MLLPRLFGLPGQQGRKMLRSRAPPRHAVSLFTARSKTGGRHAVCLYCVCRQQQQPQAAASVIQASRAAHLLASGAAILSLHLYSATPAVAATYQDSLPNQTQQQVQALVASTGSNVLSAIAAPLAAAEAPALVSNSGEVLLEGFKGIMTEGLHDLTENSMTAVGGPVTGEVLSSGGSSTANSAPASANSQEANTAAAGAGGAWDQEAAAPRTATTAAAAAASAADQAVPNKLAQAGRLGLFCGMWQAYCNALETSPLLTKIYTGIAGTLLGDLAAQVLAYQQQCVSSLAASCRASRSSSDGGSGGGCTPLRRMNSSGGGCYSGDRSSRSFAAPEFQFDVLRSARLCLYSAAIGTPMGHYWYQLLEQYVMPGSPTAPAAVAAKVCLDQLLQTPFGMALFLGGMKLLEGRPADVKSELQSKMLPALLANWKLWPAAQLINFTLIPEQQRILYGNIVGICWTCIISNMQQASTATAPTAAPAAVPAQSGSAAPASVAAGAGAAVPDRSRSEGGAAAAAAAAAV